MEDHESLQSLALICELADALQDGVDLLLSDGVVTTGVVVSRILLSSDELGGVEQLLVLSSTDGVDHRGLQIGEDRTGHILAGSSILYTRQFSSFSNNIDDSHQICTANAVQMLDSSLKID